MSPLLEGVTEERPPPAAITGGTEATGVKLEATLTVKVVPTVITVDAVAVAVATSDTVCVTVTKAVVAVGPRLDVVITATVLSITFSCYLE